MASVVSYTSRLFGFEVREHRVVLTGSGFPGKTTLLYRWKLGEASTTFPTIGFNVETVRSEGVDLTIWDIGGGCMNIFPLLSKHYINPKTIILFMIDASNDYTFQDGLYELHRMLNEDIGFLGVVFTKRDAEKCKENDLEELARKVKGILMRYSRIPTKLYDDLGQFSALMGTQTDELLKRVAHAAKKVGKQEPAETEEAKNQKRKPLPSALPKPLSKEELFKKIEEAAKNPNHELASDEFMRQMETGELDTWDHMSHLRAGYLCLHNSLGKGDVVFAAASKFLAKLDDMLKAKPGKFRNTKHRTLTIFWLRRIFHEMLSFRAAHGVFPQPEQFQEFLVKHPDLMDGNSWMPYYTKDFLFSADAREHWRLPDIEDLPPLKHQVGKKKVQDNENRPSVGNAEILKRFAYAILKTAKLTNQRRAAVINETFPAIQSHIMRIRAQALQAVEPYSETQAYFWTQMLDAAVESVPPSLGLDITKLSYESFKVLFPDLLAADDVWKEYYTPEQWNGVEARMRTVLPKLKPLPNVLQQPDQSRIEETVTSMLDEKYGSNEKQSAFQGRPSMEELFVQVRWAVKGTSESGRDSPDTHAGLLRRIFDRLVDTDPESKETSLAGAAWDAVSFLYDEKKVTAAAFWSRVVLNTFWNMDESFQKDSAQLQAKEPGNEADRARTDLFSRFLTASPELVWEGLWRLYYTEDVWKSEDAGEMLLPPDRRPLLAYIVKTA